MLGIKVFGAICVIAIIIVVLIMAAIENGKEDFDLKTVFILLGVALLFVGVFWNSFRCLWDSFLAACGDILPNTVGV